MFGADIVTRTRLTIPRPQPNVVPRPRLIEHLGQTVNYPLTIVKADAGYGKSTVLADFVSNANLPAFWYGLAESDADPLLYLLHLIYAFRQAHPTCGDGALALLEREGGAAQLWGPAVNSLVNDLLDCLPDETILVLDDYHLIDRPDINDITERFIEHMPPQLHLILATRHTPNLPGRVRWRAHHELFEIGRADLAFTPDEITSLFRQRTGHTLPLREAEALAAETEGWIMALQLLGESLTTNTAGGQSMAQTIGQLPGQLDDLFDFLAQDVLARHPPEMQRFLVETSILPQMDVALCNAIRERTDSGRFLAYLDQHSLFLVRLGPDSFRYHHLFGDFLVRRGGLSQAERQALHSKAAAYYLGRGQRDEAIFHLLEAGDFEQAAQIISKIAWDMAQAGRYERLGEWIERIPAKYYVTYPVLLLGRGDVYRFHSRFRKAFDCYEQARCYFEAKGDNHGQARALQGQALIYIDTVRPVLAEPLLRQALRLVNRSAHRRRASMLLMLAENKVNRGWLRQGERLHRRVYHLCVFDDIPEVDPRLSIRAGRLDEAHRTVLQMLEKDPITKGGRRAPRSHRESILLLSWLNAYWGQGDLARRQAEQAIELAEELRSPIVKVVALERLGHAWLTGPDYDTGRARDAYEEALALTGSIHLPRFGVEALWGLTLIEGLQGRLAQARVYAQQAIDMLEAAGDAYWAWVCRLALGAAAVLTGSEAAPSILDEAIRQGQTVGDQYGLTVAHIWQALYYLQIGQERRAIAPLGQALHLAQTNRYGVLFTHITFLGPKDPAWLAALLTTLPADDPLNRFTAFLQPALKETTRHYIGLSLRLDAGASAPLYIQSLGPFRVWLKGQEIAPEAWRRDKALRLFQLLVTRRDRPGMLHREQILNTLWPDTPPDAAANGLRVALSALRQTLDPAHTPGVESPFLKREGELLRLNLSAGVRVDADEFTSLVEEARRLEATQPDRAVDLYRRAVGLYRGDYLQDCLYEDWVGEERERLLALYLSAAERLAFLLSQRGDCNEAINLCHRILDHDPLWEEAYRLLMACHWRLGNRSLALRTYQRCARRLKEELNVKPAASTHSLLTRIASSDFSPEPM